MIVSSLLVVLVVAAVAFPAPWPLPAHSSDLALQEQEDKQQKRKEAHGCRDCCALGGKTGKARQTRAPKTYRQDSL